jgi:hypothetical protein
MLADRNFELKRTQLQLRTTPTFYDCFTFSRLLFANDRSLFSFSRQFEILIPVSHIHSLNSGGELLSSLKTKYRYSWSCAYTTVWKREGEAEVLVKRFRLDLTSGKERALRPGWVTEHVLTRSVGGGCYWTRNVPVPLHIIASVSLTSYNRILEKLLVARWSRNWTTPFMETDSSLPA